MVKVNEIFYSIQGESTLTGLPTVFIRTSGCHLRCNYCDTTYAYYKGQKLTVDDIMEQVAQYGSRFVCVSGGEPLLQKDTFKLLEKLCDAGYFVSLETSGDISCAHVDPRVKKIIDVKTPDSGEKDAFNSENINLADVNTEFKFVICSEKDFKWAESFVHTHGLSQKSNVLYSPSFGEISEKWLAEAMLKKNSSARLQIQLHKYIWSPERTGI